MHDIKPMRVLVACDESHEAAKLTHLSLFSGIGGLDLAAEMAGFRTVGQCEWADYPAKVLEKHWPDVPRWRDIRTLTGGNFHEKTGLRTVDIISGGFPCQPFSVAGKRRGKEDDRYLWPEMLRVISELRPTWVVGENVAGIVNMALDQVYADLENEGYTVYAFIIPACAVDAPHRRDRVCIVGGLYTDVSDAESVRLQRERPCWEQVSGARSEKAQSERRCDVLSDTDNGCWTLRRDGELPAVEEAGGSRADHGGRTPEYFAGEWRTTQSGLGGMVDGLSRWLDGGMSTPGHWMPEPDIPRITTRKDNRVNRLKCLGNAVVPQQFYPVFKAIADIERGIIYG